MPFEIQKISRVVINGYARRFLYRQLCSINKSFFYRKNGSQFTYTQDLDTKTIRTIGEKCKQVANV